MPAPDRTAGCRECRISASLRHHTMKGNVATKGSMFTGVVLGIVMASSHAFAQPSILSASSIASATVVMTSVVRNREPVFFVLWRGAPAWFLRGGRDGRSGARRKAGPSGEQDSAWLLFGGLTLTIDFDFGRGIARLLDADIWLTETNVVLVDNVDSPSGPSIVGTRRVTFDPGGGDSFLGMLMGHDDLTGFLQCDLTVPEPDVELALRMCRQVRGR